jgi:signal transduction histidine kinase
MATIINGFLELAQTNIDNNQIKMMPIRIDELIFSIVEDFVKYKPQYNVSVEFTFNPESETQLQCIANERLLRLMFRNIIDNACKYSIDKKAKVHIGLSPKGINITITDNGIGIPESDIANIYKSLYRGANSYGKAGHGIGLAIVKRIADIHQIEISIDSKVNIGTSVTVLLKTI